MSSYEYTAAAWYHAGQSDARRIEPGEQIRLDDVWLSLRAWPSRLGETFRDQLALGGYLLECVEDPAPWGLAAPVVGVGPDGVQAAVRAALPEPEPIPDERTIDEIRADLHAARRVARTRAELSGFGHGGHPMDSDRDSILRINNAATAALSAALAGQPFAVTWSCADDYQMLLDGPGVLALQGALAAHGAACHAHGMTIAAEIDAAADAGDREALLAIDLSADWPGVGLA